MRILRTGYLVWVILLSSLAGAESALAQTNLPAATGSIGDLPFRFNIGAESSTQPKDVDTAIKILFALTLLSIAPSIILLMTSFTRIVIVLSFVRQALSLQGTPGESGDRWFVVVPDFLHHGSRVGAHQP